MLDIFIRGSVSRLINRIFSLLSPSLSLSTVLFFLVLYVLFSLPLSLSTITIHEEHLKSYSHQGSSLCHSFHVNIFLSPLSLSLYFPGSLSLIPFSRSLTTFFQSSFSIAYKVCSVLCVYLNVHFIPRFFHAHLHYYSTERGRKGTRSLSLSLSLLPSFERENQFFPGSYNLAANSLLVKHN